MKLIAIQPFVPSGPDFAKAKEFFKELGFETEWDEGGMAGMVLGDCKFILQDFNEKAFAENYMLSVLVDNVEEFRNFVLEKQLAEKYGIKVGKVVQQPFGKEVTIIDIAGVCWHFLE